MDTEFYSIKEAARVFNVHSNTIRRAINKGFIIAIRVGEGRRSPYRISKKSVDAIHSSIILQYAQKSKKVTDEKNDGI